MPILPKGKEDFGTRLLLQSRRNTGVLIQDKHTVPIEEIVRLWEHAESDTKRVRDYILNFGGKIDKSDNQQATLINEMVQNIRFEKSVIYNGDTGHSENFPSMVVKINFIDKNMEEIYCLLYLPLDISSPGRATSILYYIDLEYCRRSGIPQFWPVRKPADDYFGRTSAESASHLNEPGCRSPLSGQTGHGIGQRTQKNGAGPPGPQRWYFADLLVLSSIARAS